MKEYGFITIELVFGFIALFMMMKLLGKTQFSQLTPFDFISSLILGELLGNAIYDPEITIWKVLFATALWGTLMFIVETVSQKAERTRKFLEGEPSIVVRKGRLMYESMKRNKLDVNQMLSLMRQSGTFSLRDVEYAVLEPNGQISVLRKSGPGQPTRQDLQLPNRPVELPMSLILDGKLNADNLRQAGKTEAWLMDELARHDVSGIGDVLYAEWTEGQPLLVMKRG